MDTAKGCNFIFSNGGKMEDYWGHHKATRPMLPFIAIPTTAGTGSECQSYALIAQENTHAKMACGDPKAAARVVSKGRSCMRTVYGGHPRDSTKGRRCAVDPAADRVRRSCFRRWLGALRPPISAHASITSRETCRAFCR